jgi:hypothetical protein
VVAQLNEEGTENVYTPAPYTKPDETRSSFSSSSSSSSSKGKRLCRQQ